MSSHGDPILKQGEGLGKCQPRLGSASRSFHVHLLKTDLGPLDVLSRVGNDLFYEQLLDRSIEYEVEGLRLKVLNLETVIECKEIADRDKDHAALPILRRTLELKRSAGD